LISKDEIKIRLQANDFSSLWYAMKELIKRLGDIFGQDDSFEIGFPESIPLNELFIVIEEHYQIRCDEEKLKKLLSDRSY
jgi:hypothetical protein